MKYKQNKVIVTGSDNVELDGPSFEIVNINIDTVKNVLSVEVLHEVNQGSVIQKHSRTFDVKFKNLSAAIKVTGKEFIEAIENKILELPQYIGAIKQ